MMLEAKLPSVAATGTERETLVAGVALFSERPAELVRWHEQVLHISFSHREHADGREHWIAASGGVQIEIKAVRTATGEPTLDGAATLSQTDKLDGGTPGVSRAELSFRVPDVAAAAARALVAGGTVLQKAEAFDWGTFAVVLDLDGNRIGLFAPPRAASTEDEA